MGSAATARRKSASRGRAPTASRCTPRAHTWSTRLPILPGMTAGVDIVTGRKTVLAYLVTPVLRLKERAPRER